MTVLTKVFGTQLSLRLLSRIANTSVTKLTFKMSITTSDYGSWRSPITSKIVSESSVKFQEVHVDSCPENADTVYWGELRFDEGGRIVVCSQKVGEDKNTSWTPKDYNARTRVHEYGGGAIFVNNKVVYFSNYKDQQMYSQSSPDEAPQLITTGEKTWRYADGSFNAKTSKIYCVREDHSVVESKKAKEPVNTVVTIDPVTKQQFILTEGADFYSSPRVSPDGKKIAWVQWNHPNMPWDSTELWTGDLSATGDAVSNPKQIVSGTDISVMQPSWTPNNELLYIGDQTEWWNLYHVNANGDHTNLLPRDKETGGPHWVFAFYGYAVDPKGTGRIVLNSGSELGVLNMNTKEYQKLDTGFTSHTCMNLTADGQVYCVAGSPTKFECVIRINLETKEVKILQESKSLDMDTGYYSIPEEISWKTTNDDVSYGYLYPPKNKDFVAPEGTKPPLLVQVHGGPTSQTSNVLSLKKQYFTSRGFAVLDVNYRGSTGYGKTYRHKLRAKWGVSDIDDCCFGALYLGDIGRVDENKLCIDGGSAGGYTTLACLTFKNVFKAGASHYGIGDLEALAGDTHKFESRYLDNLIAPYTGDGIKIYKERSPINYIEKLDCPIALFQGDEDKIVPPNQAEMMYKAVKEKGIPTMHVLFEGEQHGFRKAENIQTALDGEFYFFSKVFGFKAADNDIKIPIANLK
ncbi:dipeptidyl-peptidase 5-like isoform X1 [Mytilus edulis]|uniref:dipeptidyl-peptidase 5-like isoform X1 n=1 Tax=Mytilus edulis TaxID=6550 RepID=UPI0039F0DD20